MDLPTMLTVVENQSQEDLFSDLLTQIPRGAVVDAVASSLRLDRAKAQAIVEAFDRDVAQPLEANLKKLKGRDLAKRNPLIYTVRGVESVDDWSERVLADKETSAIEGHIGTFLEHVARIVSGGTKPGNGVDLQLEKDGVVHLFCIQAAPNTKNAGSKRSDINSLKQAARPLRADKLPVSLNIAILTGQAKPYQPASEPGITVLASDEFWHRISGIPDFRVLLLHASRNLSWLVKSRAADEIARIKQEARVLFADADGNLDYEALATFGVRRGKPPLDAGLLDY